MGRRADRIQRNASELTASGYAAWSHPADVSREDDVDDLVKTVVRARGRIDALVNSAGIARRARLLDAGVESWDDVLATNLRGAFLLTQRVAREQVKTGGGAIVHIASIDSFAADGEYVSYNASKAGLMGLVRSAAVELAAHGVRVNAVNPGYVNTEMETKPEHVLAYLRGEFARVPMRRLIEPAEIAAAVAFLVSDKASGITGTGLTVDGGLTANWYVLETMPFGGGADSPGND